MLTLREARVIRGLLQLRQVIRVVKLDLPQTTTTTSTVMMRS